MEGSLGSAPWRPAVLKPNCAPPFPWFGYSVLCSVTQKIPLLPKWAWVTCSGILTNSQQFPPPAISSETPHGLCTFPRYAHRVTPGRNQLPAKDHKPQCRSWRMLTCRWAPVCQSHVIMAAAERAHRRLILRAGASAARLSGPWGQSLMCTTICNAQFPFHSFRLN